MADVYTAAANKPSVVEALSQVMAEVQAVGKTSRNLEQGYNFRGIDAVVNAVGPALRKHGVIPVPYKVSANYRDVLTSRGKNSRECTVLVGYRFYGPAGDYIECEVPGESMDFGDKGAPKAMSVAYRILLLQALCIPTDEPDADSQTYERAVPSQWDPVEQENLREAFAQEINSAKTAQELADVGQRVQSSRKVGDMSPATYDHLRIAGTARRAELDMAAAEVSDDATAVV